jgi:CheY-like chemotaxis protein
MSTDDSRFRLVIIDDNRSEIVLLREALADSGHPIDVLAFGDGAQALAGLMGESQVDLVLCDISMPVMDGLDLVERLRTIPHLARTLFVLMSTSIDLELPATLRRRCQDVACIRKGVTWSDYRGIVDALHRRMTAHRLGPGLGIEDPDAPRAGLIRD